MSEGAGGHGEVDFPTARPPKPAIQIGSDDGLLRPEGDGLRGREERLLGLDFLPQPRTPEPLVQD